MEWIKIKKEYPKAHKQLEWWGSKQTPFNYYQDHIVPLIAINIKLERTLYDFFDGVGINIYIADEVNTGAIGWYMNLTGFDKHFIDCGINEYKTRIEAEDAAFMKAFEILEASL